MRRFWDRRARENPWFFVLNTLDYRAPDRERFWASGERDLEALLKATGAELSGGEHVVEIGCGAGRMTRAIAARASSVTAFDVSAEMLALARRHNPDLDRVDWIHGDGTTLAPLADASADAVLSHVVFQHLPDPRITLGYVREIGRVLRPGGWAAFQISNDAEIHKRRGLGGRARDRVRALAGRAPRGQSHPAWRGSAVDLSQLRDTSEAADLEIERISGEGTQFCFVLASRKV